MSISIWLKEKDRKIDGFRYLFENLQRQLPNVFKVSFMSRSSQLAGMAIPGFDGKLPLQTGNQWYKKIYQPEYLENTLDTTVILLESIAPVSDATLFENIFRRFIFFGLLEGYSVDKELSAYAMKAKIEQSYVGSAIH